MRREQRGGKCWWCVRITPPHTERGGRRNYAEQKNGNGRCLQSVDNNVCFNVKRITVDIIVVSTPILYTFCVLTKDLEGMTAKIEDWK